MSERMAQEKGFPEPQLPRDYSWPQGHWNWPGTTRSPFKHGVKCGNMIFVGGQCALDQHGNVLHPYDIVEQSKTVMKYIEDVLAEFGATMSDVVQMNCFYVGGGSVEDWENSFRVRAAAFPDPGPAGTAIPVPKLAYEGMMIEIQVVAMVRG